MKQNPGKMVRLADSLRDKEHSDDRYKQMISEIDEYAIIFLNKEGIVETWNKGAQKIKQYEASEIIGKHFNTFYPESDKKAGLPQRLLKEAEDNGRVIREGWRVRKDGSKFWGSITLTAIHNRKGDVIGYAKITRDLTARRSAEDQLKQYAEELQLRNEALRKSEERFQKMVSEIQDYAIILLDRKGIIQNWNVGAERIKGYSSEEAIGRNFRIFYLPEDRDRKLPEQLIGEATLTGKALNEGWRVRKDGTTFWASIVITALHDRDGSVIGFSKVTRDLTDRKLAEDQIRKYTQELEQRNQELEQFAYISSHDLQEPLRKIHVFTDVIARNLHDEGTIQRYCEKIKISSARMLELIKSVLAYSQMSQVMQVEVTDLNEILQDVLGDFDESIAEKKARIISEKLPELPVNKLQIHQLFSNLIGNALKYNDKTPEIRISHKIVKRSEIDSDDYELNAERYTRISFSDNGIGFEQKYADTIFGMFQRLHAKHEFTGTGIGLAICKKIVMNHEGYITAESEPGKGTTFHVYLPT